MDFGALPPEINSGRMYVGPRSGPMLAAATAWDGLAAELDWAATSYGSALADLTSMSWLGPASASMVAAATPYVAWMSTTAAQAQQTAAQAKAAAAAYEAAFAMTVPPPVIAANRALLMTLVATNILGQNTPAIAATEAHYGEMWAQDAVAMYGYAGASAAASTVTPFTAPKQNTDPAGSANQVAQAATQASGAPVQAMASAGPQLIPTTAAPNALHSLASTSAAPSTVTLSSFLPAPLGTGPALTTANADTIFKRTLQAYFFTGMPQFIASIAQQLVPGTPSGAGAAGSSVLDAPSFQSLADLGGIGPASVSSAVSAPAKAAMLAGMGKAGSIGGMSVPPGWTASSPAVQLAAAELPITSINAAPASGPASLLRGVPLAGAGRRVGGFTRRYGFRHKLLRRPPMAG